MGNCHEETSVEKGYFDHIHEMKDSYRGLKKAKRSLERSLKNPNSGQQERSLLEDALKTTDDHIQRIDELFKPYGGLALAGGQLAAGCQSCLSDHQKNPWKFKCSEDFSF